MWKCRAFFFVRHLKDSWYLAYHADMRIYWISFSYKSFLPKDMRAQIQDCNFLTRKRIRFRFKRFIQQFSQCRTTVRDLKLKYLISMESLEKSFYTETFQVKEPSGVQRIILVAADTGIQWCRELSKDTEQVGTMSTTVLVYILEDKETDVSLEHLFW